MQRRPRADSERSATVRSSNRDLTRLPGGLTDRSRPYFTKKHSDVNRRTPLPPPVLRISWNGILLLDVEGRCPPGVGIGDRGLRARRYGRQALRKGRLCIVPGDELARPSRVPAVG